MLLALLPLLEGCTSPSSESGVADPAFTVKLAPVVPFNEAPFADLDALDLVLDPDGAAPDRYTLDEVPASGGTTATPQLPPFTDTVVQVEGYTAGALVSLGRSAPLTGSEGVVDATVFVAQVDAAAALGSLSPGLYRPMLAALGDGRFLVAGGVTEASSGGATTLTDGVFTVGILDLTTPEPDLAFVSTEEVDPWVDVTGGAHAERFGATLSPLTVGEDAGRFLVVGGAVAPGWSEPDTITADVRIYNPEAGIWESPGAAASLDRARVEHVAVAAEDGAIVVAGGWSNDGTGLSPGRGVEIYDPAVRGFGAPLEDDALGQLDLAGTTVPEEGVLLCGGAVVSLTTDAKAGPVGTWSATQHCALVGADHQLATERIPELPAQLAGAAMFGLPDGRVLLTGGATPSGATDLTTGVPARNNAWILSWPSSWSQLSRMNLARAGHVMTLLPDGRVLIAGGASSYQLTGIPEGALACMEIFDPSDNSFSLTGDCAPDGSTGVMSAPAWRPSVATDPRYGPLFVGGANAGASGEAASAQVTLYYPEPAP